jgi:hypothetical protein
VRVMISALVEGGSESDGAACAPTLWSRCGLVWCGLVRSGWLWGEDLAGAVRRIKLLLSQIIFRYL